MWPNTRLLELLKTEFPIVQAPMAGAMDTAVVVGACEGGALGSLPCAMISVEKAREQINVIRQQTSRPFGLNFFCHTPVEADPKKEAAWRERLAPYYRELGLDPSAPVVAANRAPFDAAMCALVEEMKPPVVSFHFGLPQDALLKRVKAAGCVVLSSATTVKEAVWLEERGADVVIAQGAEAGGHRGMFLTQDVAAQPGTLALVPQIVDAVRVPVIAAGGIADGRGVAAAFMLGAAGVQIGTAYLACPESTIAQPFRDALAKADADSTATTNLMTGKPARGIFNRLMRELGPLSADVPDFPYAATAIGPLRAAAEKKGSGEFTPLWSGQAAALARAIPAADMTRSIAADAMRLLGGR
jgi:nitronate monooxygenase